MTTRIVRIPKGDVSQMIEVTYKGEIIACIDVFASGSVFVDKASRVCINKTTHTLTNEAYMDSQFVTIALEI